MVAQSRAILLWALAISLATGGCALSSGAKQAKPPLTREQAEWWAANKHRKEYVSGRGYRVEGTSGFFDHEGRPITSELISAGASPAESEGLLERFSPKKGIANVKKAVGRGPNEAKAKLAMEAGDTLFRQKQFTKAAKQYRNAYNGWPDSSLEEEAMFKAAEAEFFADRYSKAEDEYAALIKKYPSTQYLNQVVTRRFEIARYWENFERDHPRWPIVPNLVDKTRPLFDTEGHAIRVYERIRMDDPIGPLADDAVMATANFYFLKGRWEDADYHYGLLRTEFPKSEHQYQAHLLGLRCKLLRYQGPGYEGAPLDEAEDLATQLLTQFPTELGSEREKVAHTRADVRHQRALREWEMARYYDKGEYFGAAKVYYAKITKEYADTQLAQESRARLEQIKGEPDAPPQQFEWLVKLFPETKKEGPVLPKNFTPNDDSTIRR